MAIVTDLYSSLEGLREGVTERWREKTSKMRGDCVSYDKGTALQEPIETKYLNFDC